MPVYLIRHAHAGSRAAWRGDDRDRPLSDKGKAQAAALLGVLDGAPVGRVVSSAATRCVQTVEPLAAAHELAIETRKDLFEGGDPDAVTSFLLAHADQNLAASSHGDVIPKVLRRLAAMGMKAKEGAISQKGSLWVIEVDDERPVKGKYYPPV